jgi:hypothetical protein
MRNFCVVNIPVLAPYIQETLTDNDIRNAQGEPVVLPPCPSDNLESLKAYDEFYVANLLPLTATNFPVYFNPIAWENFSILTSWAYYATDFFHQFPE